MTNDFPNETCCLWETWSAHDVQERAAWLEKQAVSGHGSPLFNSTVLRELEYVALAIPKDVQEAAGISVSCAYVLALQREPISSDVVVFARRVK